MVTEGKVTSQQKTEVPLKADTVCIHGDGEHALDFAKYIKETLTNNKITVTAFNSKREFSKWVTKIRYV